MKVKLNRLCNCLALLCLVTATIIWISYGYILLSTLLYIFCIIFLCLPEGIIALKSRYDRLFKMLVEDNLSEEVLSKLAKSLNWKIRRSVAEHPNVTANILDKLSHDKHWYVAFSVAINPKTSEETLNRLAKHPDWATRFKVANHPNTSNECLTELSKDHDISVRETAEQELSRRTKK